MIARSLHFLGSALLALGLLGCPDSADIATGDIRAEIDVTVTPEDGKVEAKLYELSDSFSVELTDGDRLVAAVDGGAQIPLEADTTIYRADIPVDAGEVRVDLLRDGGDNAFMVAAIPEPMMLDSTTLSLADDPITVTWSNPIDGGLVAIFVDSCADIAFETPEQKEPFSDMGSYTLTRAEIESEAGSGADCAKLVIGRETVNNGEGGGFYSTSQIRAIRYQREDVTLTP